MPFIESIANFSLKLKKERLEQCLAHGRSRKNLDLIPGVAYGPQSQEKSKHIARNRP